MNKNSLSAIKGQETKIPKKNKNPEEKMPDMQEMIGIVFDETRLQVEEKEQKVKYQKSRINVEYT